MPSYAKSYSLKVLTLNVWGLPWKLTPHKNERLKAIAAKLNDESFDVVCLQELWMEKDFKMISKLTSSVLPYSHYFHSGVLGSGLAILTKWRIILTFFHQWPLNGYIHMIQHADWFGGKGVALAQLKFNDLTVNVYNTHLHARYSKNDRYIAHRVVQSLETGVFTHLTSAGSDLSIFCGDLNSEPGDICYYLIVELARLEDTQTAVGSEFSGWGTCETSRISFSGLEDSKGTCLDHILFKSKCYSEAELYWFPFEDKVPGCDFSYSDHEAVAAKLYIKTHTKKESYRDPYRNHVFQALSICHQAINEVAENTRFYWYLFLFTILIIILHPYFIVFPTWFYCILFLPMTIFLNFTLFMATIWDRLETRGILGAIKNLKKMIGIYDMKKDNDL